MSFSRRKGYRLVCAAERGVTVNSKSVWTVLCVAGLMIGCAAAPTTYETGPEQKIVSGYDSVRVTVDAPPYIRQQPGYAPTSTALQKEFIERVRNSGKYQSVGTDVPGERPLDVRLMITKLNYVHGGARAFGGILAGHAVLTISMTVQDHRTTEVLRRVNTTDASRHLHGVFGSTTGRQVTAAAEELASQL